MKLVRINIKHYRCYNEEVSFDIDDLTCIIGKNDIGKSTILEALNSFFNDVIDKGDLTSNIEDNTVELRCFFDDLPQTIILDSSEQTNAKDEFLLNAEGLLEIKKTFTFGKTVSKACYLIAKHPTNEKLVNILSLKNTQLKSLAKELEIDLATVNQKKNPPLRKAIRDSIESEIEVIEIKVDGNVDNESNLKEIWKNLKKFLPIFSLFKVDKNLDDKDKDVQDPMKQAIKESLSVPEIQELLEKIEKEVKKKSTEVAELTIEKLQEIDKSLAEKLKADFNKEPTWDKIFDLTLLNENNIPLNKRGSGVRRLVLLSFFQAQAEKRKFDENAPAIIYGIEEPETSQHPNHQKILINSLIELSERDNVQILFTTHSSNLVRELPIESLVYIYKDDENRLFIEYGFNISEKKNNEETLNKIIHTLGVLPNPIDRIKVLLFVEGNHDVNALFRYSEILHLENPSILKLSDNDDIGIVISGGSSLKFYIDNKYLEGLGKPQIHIYDSDVAEYKTYVKKVNDEGSPKKKAFNTVKSEIENYLSKEAIEEAYAENGTNIVIPLIDASLNVPLTVAKALYETTPGQKWEDLTEKNQKKKESHVKKFLNTQAVNKMTVARIKNQGGYEEIKGWLETIKCLSNS